MREDAVETLGASLRGQVIRGGDGGYDEARALYNGMIDKRPALIVRCADAADVMAAVNFGRNEGLDVAVRGGGHNGAGLGSVDDGLVIDLSQMRGVRVDPDASTADVSGGALLGDLDHAGHPFGLATPAGIVASTGVSGLTLGGGHGHLTRKYGLSIDNLLGVDLVLADGSFVKASEKENADLFWAVRGGGGNFGVATSFTFRLHPVRTVGVGITLWPVDQTPDVLRWYRDFLPQAPEDLNGFFAVLNVPPGPPFPEEIHTKSMCGVVWCFAGDPSEVEKAIAPATAVGAPAFHFGTPMPYPALQSMFDPLYPSGYQWYWRGDVFDRITDEAVESHLEWGSKVPTLLSTMHLYPIDGAVHSVGAEDTPWRFRNSGWSGVIAGIDPDPVNAPKVKDWCVGYWESLHPESVGAAYVNFMMEEGQDRVKATYGSNYERLSAIKAKYDPGNFFHVNQNIKPGA